MRWSAALGTATSILLGLSSARALEAGEVGGEPLRLDITNASSLLYNVDNRDSRPNTVETLANDDWGFWYNRLNVQANWGKWQLGLRLDSAWFYTSPNAVDIATELERARPRPLAPGASSPPDYFRSRFFEAGEELSNRYINWIYPAKYYVGYTTRDVELTVGDFYAQLGRGFVLSIRKLDELSSDTTVRGVRATGRVRAGDLRLRLTGLGGVMNPLRIDEASGRYLGVTNDVTPDVISVTEAGMPRQQATDFIPDPQATYAPDRVVAAQIEAGAKGFKLGTQGSMFLRQDALNQDVVRTADTILIGSQSIEFPDIAEVGSLYLEGALQDLSHSDNEGLDLLGHALYGAGTLAAGPFNFTVEGKHYRRFFPVSANVDLTQAREFSLVQYSAPPTTEAFWVDTEFERFNTCTSGGRAKTDVHITDTTDVYFWVGHYLTWAESAINDRCKTTDDNLNRVWDAAVGTEFTTQKRKSRANFAVGGRHDTTDRAIADANGNDTNLFYQEGYLRFDWIQWLGGPYSLQFQGWHRRRKQTLGGPKDPWWEGQQLFGFEWAPKLSLAFGVEYNSNDLFAATTEPSPEADLPDITWYFNGQAKWRFDSASSVSLFVGQRRGALRCVGGVCRVFPPFEGARLDATVRF